MRRVSPQELVLDLGGKMFVPARIFAPESLKVEEDAVSQLRNATELPLVDVVLATPDIHKGYGVPIGSVIGASGLISPSAVGYDINCGMRLHVTPFVPDEVPLEKIITSIRRDIPLGEGKGNVRVSDSELSDILAFGTEATSLIAKNPAYKHRVWEVVNWGEEMLQVQKIESRGTLSGNPDYLSSRAHARGLNQLGTLGGGNHFIEFQVIEKVFDANTAEEWKIRKDKLVFMIHSGSRGLGHQVGGDYMKLAEEVGNPTPDRELQYFIRGTKEAEEYMGAMNAAANYAFVNRMIMAALVKHNINHTLGQTYMPLVYDVAHNIAKEEEHPTPDIEKKHSDTNMIVHRKGATRAFGPKRMNGTIFEKTGQPIIIPGSMGTSSYILAGVDDNEKSLCSVNHGAGRVMGRMEAGGKYHRKTGKLKREGKITDEMFKEAMEGILLSCENERDIKGEAPQAYKDIDAVIDCVVKAGLANLVAKVRPLAVLKG